MIFSDASVRRRLFQLAAVGKSLLADDRHRVGQGHAGQTGAAVERTLGDHGDLRRNAQRGQCAAGEGALADDELGHGSVAIGVQGLRDGVDDFSVLDGHSGLGQAGLGQVARELGSYSEMP